MFGSVVLEFLPFFKVSLDVCCKVLSQSLLDYASSQSKNYFAIKIQAIDAAVDDITMFWKK